MLGIRNCCPRALPHKHDGLVFPLRERLQRGSIVLVARIGYRISRLASRWLAAGQFPGYRTNRDSLY